MTVGAPADQAEINAAAAQITRSLFASMQNVTEFKAFLDTRTTGDLTTLGFTSNEAAVLKSAFADLATLVSVFQGAATQATTYDFRTFSKQLLGVGLY